MKNNTVETEYTDSKYTYLDLLDIESNGNKKYELIDGEIFAMSSAPIDHGIISTMIATLLNNQLIDSPCQVIGETLKVRVKTDTSDDVFRPDVTVVCPPYGSKDLVTETPSLVIEVLSKSTELKDRTTKLQSYLNIKGLKGYLIVSKELKRIEWYRIIKGKLESTIFLSGDTVNIDEWIFLNIDQIYSKSDLKGSTDEK